jgi:hypothetical protein
MGARRRGRRDAGYLLVEALAALALSALVLGALVSLTGVLKRAADKAAFGVEEIEVAGRAVHALAGEIRRAAHARWAAAGPKATRAFVFSGSPDQVTFALLPGQDTGLRAPVAVAYQIAPDGDLLRAEGPIEPDLTGAGDLDLGRVARIPLEGRRLRFAYVGRQTGGGEIVTDAWTDPLKMPAAMRIDRLDAAGAIVASLRVPLLIDGESGCAGQTGFCSRAPNSEKPAAAEGAGAAPSASGEPE